MLEISVGTFGDYISRVALVNYLSYRFLWMISKYSYPLSLGLCVPWLVQPCLGTIWPLMFWTDKGDVWMLVSISVLISKPTCLKIGSFLLHPDTPQIISKIIHCRVLHRSSYYQILVYLLFLLFFFFFLSLKNSTLLPVIWIRALVFTSWFLSTSSHHLWCDSISSNNSDFTCLKFFNFHPLSSMFIATDCFF